MRRSGRAMKALAMIGGPALPALLMGVAIASNAETFGYGWPEGEFAEEVGYFCTACHSAGIITQQGLSPRVWDDVIEWMVEEQGMPELDPETRARYVEFLAEQFGPDSHGTRGG